MGDINVFTGPMKCGKSFTIMQEAKRQIIAGKSIQIFKPSLDERFGSECICDRNEQKLKAININSIEDIKKYDVDVYVIDEFQFLKGDISVIEELALKGKKFFIAGLNLTSEKKAFGKMGELLCLADNVKIMTSICEVCKSDEAIFSYYKGNDKCNEIKIGDKEYMPVCRECYKGLMKNKN